MNEDLKQAYSMLDHIYHKYLDLNPKYYPLLNTWTISALYHKEFPTFPFLFLNAMKGSGKSRLLKLVACLIDGEYTTSLTPAVLFRTNGPLMIDEVESVSNKEKNDLRELLNAAYKKGLKVMRMQKNEKTSEQEVKKYDPYRAVALANINGIDDVLEDRCIKLTLEKSSNSEITRRLELFEHDPDIQAWFKLRERLLSVGKLSIDETNLVSVSVCDGTKKVYEDVLRLVVQYYNGISIILTPTNTTTHTTLTNTYQHKELQNLFSDDEIIAQTIFTKIDPTPLQGRDLELWYPMFITGAIISNELFDELLETAQEFMEARTTLNALENRDIVLIGFLANFLHDHKEGEYVPLTQVVNQFHLNDQTGEKWFNPEWLSRALDRNKLVLKKRRMRGGREVMFDFKKVAEKAKQFGVEDE